MSMSLLEAFYSAQPAFWFMIVFMVMVGYSCFLDRRFTKEAKCVEAEVIDYETIKGESSTLYEAKIRYVFEGNTYYHALTARSPVKRYQIGERLPLLVNPANPHEVRIQGSVEENPLRLFLVFKKIAMWICILAFLAWFISALY